jgi:hypothetical protein
MPRNVKEFRLIREGDQIFLQFADAEGRTAVKPVWARPITARGAEVSFIGPDKQEVLMVSCLDALDSASRRIAEEELSRRYVFPRIMRVMSATASFGVRYWHVETDLGERHFALKNASKNAVWLSDDHLVLNDTLGCRYQVCPYSALDAKSRAEIEKVI